MRPSLLVAATFLGALVFAVPAFADKVVLTGGTTIEGKASRHGDKVVVELESGEISLPADSVERIEKTQSLVGVFESKYAVLGPKDVPSRLALADYCRNHDMRSREHQLLLEVIGIDSNNAAARARLGFVKTDGGWTTREQLMRSKGYVQRDGQWMSPAQAHALDESERARVAAENRDAAAAEADAHDAELAAEQADAEAEANARAEWASSDYYGYGYGYGYGGYAYGARSRTTARRSAGFARPGSPSSMSVVKVPYSHGRRH